MKFLDITPLARLDTFLNSVDVGDYIVHGNLEAYSCKLAGLDKKLSRSLDENVLEGSSPLELSMSPIGPLSESSNRKTLIYLILTLNHIYPDYDFTLLRAQHFRREPGGGGARESIETHLLEVAQVWEASPQAGETPFLDALWAALDEAIELKDCEVYTYKSDNETDPFGEEANLWSFNYFFYNKRLKRILYLAARAVSKAAAEEADDDDSKYLYADEEETEADPGMVGEMEDL